jgi:hypothetical protein
MPRFPAAVSRELGDGLATEDTEEDVLGCWAWVPVVAEPDGLAEAAPLVA